MKNVQNTKETEKPNEKPMKNWGKLLKIMAKMSYAGIDVFLCYAVYY